MYKTENLERLSNYIMATVYTHNPKKIATLKKQVSSIVDRELPQAVKTNNTNKIDKLLSQIASDLNVSDKDFKKILHGNFLSVLHLMENARKKVHDGQTLLRYLEVIAHINGTTLPRISKELGRKTDSYIANLALHDQYPTRKRVLCKSVSLFGVSSKAMLDAVSRSKISGPKSHQKAVKRQANMTKKKLKIIPDDDFDKRLDEIRDKWGMPPNYMETVNDFMLNVQKRKYKVTKGATEMAVHKIHMTENDIVTVPVPMAVMYSDKDVYPENPPKNLIYYPSKYRRERKRVSDILLNAKTVDETITIIKSCFRIVLNNRKWIKAYIYNFSWPLKDKHHMSASITLQPYVHKKKSAKVRRLLKKYNR